MVKYDIGILTFWNVPNYGTFAQAYALQKVIQSLYDERDCKQIAYLNQKHFDDYYSWKPRYSPRHKQFYTELWKRTIPNSKYNKKKKMFFEYYNKIPHTDDLNGRGLEQVPFETVVLGSDIIWDFTFKIFNNDKFLFGNQMNTNHVISYATSFGTVKEDANLPEYVKQGLSKMKHISVRDIKSSKIIEKNLGYTPQVVLDPTYLWDFYSDKNIVKPQYEKYMVVYGQDFNENQIKQIIEYAKENDLLLICLDCNDDNYHWCDVTLKQYELSPFEWIGFFMHANTVATTTFHGLTFSIIFNKKFAFCETPFIMDKAGDYLKLVGLYDLFHKENVTIKEMIEYCWDYSVINDILKNERKKSIDFLKNSI